MRNDCNPVLCWEYDKCTLLYNVRNSLLCGISWTQFLMLDVWVLQQRLSPAQPLLICPRLDNSPSYVMAGMSCFSYTLGSQLSKMFSLLPTSYTRKEGEFFFNPCISFPHYLVSLFMHLRCKYNPDRWLGGSAVRHWIRDRKVHGLIPSQCTIK